jgi:hypothetical protein
VIDGVDGKVHHVRLRDLDAATDAPMGAIVETRPESRGYLSVRSDLSIADQIRADGATWLDRQLVSAKPSEIGQSGFGAEIQEAMARRIDHLVEAGLARRDGRRVVFARDLLDTLRRRELDAAGARMAAQTGGAYRPTAGGDKVSGAYRQRLTLASGRFAMIDDGLGFTLVPWRPELERHFGREVSGVTLPGGRIDWSFGRQKGLGR